MKKIKNIYFLLFANCLPVKGAKQSIICDVQKNRYIYIPNLLYDVLIINKKRTVNEVKKYYNHDLDAGIDTYFKKLVDEEMGFYTDAPQNFLDMNMKWEFPTEITNALIDYKKKSPHNFKNIAEQLNALNCKALEIRFYDICRLATLSQIVDSFQKTTLTSITLIFKFNARISANALIELSNKYPRIKTIIVYESPFEELINDYEKTLTDIFYTQEELYSEKCCGKISSKLFITNLKLFTESLHHNSCLHKKIAIDAKGEIKNCPSMAQSFGNIQNTTLEEALNHPEFKKYWNITKDQVAVCKDCEFRYICTDCRAYLENPEDMYSKPLKCGYNPYTNEWEEWSANPLKQKAIEYYNLKNSPNNN